MNLLVDSNIIYKKRGIGMFVALNAKSKLMQKRKDHFYDNFIFRIVDEANKLKLQIEDIQYMFIFYKTLIENNNANPKTIIISTHLIGEVANVLEDIIIINKKRAGITHLVPDLTEKVTTLDF